jgi:hypothetical protein
MEGYELGVKPFASCEEEMKIFLKSVKPRRGDVSGEKREVSGRITFGRLTLSSTHCKVTDRNIRVVV